MGPRAGLDAVAERKNSQPLPGLETPIIQPVAQRYTTELSRVWYLVLAVMNVPGISGELPIFVFVEYMVDGIS
jgi:hypothetical protein